MNKLSLISITLLLCSCTTRGEAKIGDKTITVGALNTPYASILEQTRSYLDSNGYILTNEKMETNLGGVYAVGDIRNTPLRQIITATSDGAIASVTAYNYIKNLNKEKNV